MSAALQRRAMRVMPGGVNSPVRAFGAVGGTPPFLVRARGARVWDADDVCYLDMVGGWGPLLFGHAAPFVVSAVRRAARRGVLFGSTTALEIEFAETLLRLTRWPEQVRLANSGTEASATALRLARGFTGRRRVLRFDGSYHGHVDFGETMSVPYDDLDAARDAIVRHGADLAAVIVEPVAANVGVVVPSAAFLGGLRELASASGALLVFDEVVTGFRLAAGGAAQYFGVTPDLAVYGKVIGGGLPIGAVAGPRRLMAMLAPAGPVFHGGTFAGNPVSVSAGLAQLRAIEADVSLYDRLERAGAAFEADLTSVIERRGYQARLSRAGSMWTLFLSDGPAFARFFHAMLRRRVLLAASPLEANFISTAHARADLDFVVAAAAEALAEAHVPE